MSQQNKPDIVDMTTIELTELVVKYIDELKLHALEQQLKHGANKKEYWQGSVDALVALKEIIKN